MFMILNNLSPPDFELVYTANFGGCIPTESCSFSSEKSYSPKRFMCAHETTE